MIYTWYLYTATGMIFLDIPDDEPTERKERAQQRHSQLATDTTDKLQTEKKGVTRTAYEKRRVISDQCHNKWLTTEAEENEFFFVVVFVTSSNIKSVYGEISFFALRCVVLFRLPPPPSRRRASFPPESDKSKEVQSSANIFTANYVSIRRMHLFPSSRLCCLFNNGSSTRARQPYQHSGSQES